MGNLQRRAAGRVLATGPRTGLGAFVAFLTLVVGVVLAPVSQAVGEGGPVRSARVAASVVYPGSDGVSVRRASGQMDRLAETSRRFRRFVRRYQDRMWSALGHDPDCAQAPVVWVKEFRRRNAFLPNVATVAGGPSDVPERCQGSGGFHFFVKRDGRWQAPYALGGQETLRCKVLRRWKVPRMHGSRTCFNGHDIVRYNP